jgi:hypothetical protein
MMGGMKGHGGMPKGGRPSENSWEGSLEGSLEGTEETF